MFRLTKPRRISGLVVLLLAAVTFGQWPIKVPKLPGLNPFEKDPPLTTALTDAILEVPFFDDFNPQDAAPLSILPRDADGGFILERPGAYTFTAQSYCLRAGTHSPGSGKGYLYAPLKGNYAEIVRSVLKRSAANPDIPQHDVQILLWAILAQTKPSKMGPEIQGTGRRLLTRQELSKLEGSAFSELSQDAFSRAIGKLPPQTQQVYEAERRLRSAFTGEMLPYNELERIAVLTGEPLPGKDDRPIPSGRWSYHPDGYFVRYFPEGYQETDIEVYVPEKITVIRDERNRVTEIDWINGRRIVIDYDNSIAPAAVSRDGSYLGHAFRSVRLEVVPPKPTRTGIRVESGPVKLAEWNASGWTLTGADQDTGQAGQAGPRFTGAAARVDLVKRQSGELGKLVGNVTASGKQYALSPLTTDETANLVGLMQLAAALGDLLDSKRVNRDTLSFDPAELVQRAWASELNAVLAAHRINPTSQVRRDPLEAVFLNASWLPPVGEFAFPAGRSNSFSGSGGAATPAETGRQRLAVSDRPKNDDDECRSNFESCQTQSGLDSMSCMVNCSNNPDLSTYGKAKCVYNCDKAYSEANRKCSSAQRKCQRGGR